MGLEKPVGRLYSFKQRNNQILKLNKPEYIERIDEEPIEVFQQRCEETLAKTNKEVLWLDKPRKEDYFLLVFPFSKPNDTETILYLAAYASSKNKEIDSYTQHDIRHFSDAKQGKVELKDFSKLLAQAVNELKPEKNSGSELFDINKYVRTINSTIESFHIDGVDLTTVKKALTTVINNVALKGIYENEIPLESGYHSFVTDVFGEILSLITL